MANEDFVRLHIRYRADFALAGTTPLAELLFLRSLAHCGLNDTKGRIASSDLSGLVAGLSRPQRLVLELTDPAFGDPFWLPMPFGWCIRSWDKWQGDYDQVQAKRARDAERKREKRREEREARMNGEVA